jgi:transcriptional regulator with XRE-family HTH domain
VSNIERIAWVRRLVKNGGARAIREAAGLSASELARSIEASPGAVSLWERGLRFPREQVALRYATALESLLVHSRRARGPKRLGNTQAFVSELERLAADAPEPFRSQLLALAEQSSEDAA